MVHLSAMLFYAHVLSQRLSQLVPDTSSKYFVISFKKLIARRGCPEELLRNNETVLSSQGIQRFASNRNTDWKFSLTNAPYHGGFWERLVSIVKHWLKKTVGKAFLNFF